jgi:hypothetical protein
MVKVAPAKEIQVLETAQAFVGMGPAGLALWHQSTGGSESRLALESEHIVLGRGNESSLHLVDTAFEHPLLENKESFLEAKVRWDRQWVSPTEVDWDDKEWSQVLPQWQFYFIGNKKFVEWKKDLLPQSSDENVKFSNPVSKLVREGNTWVLSTPKYEIRSPKIIWGAGIRAFQNAVGKMEAQDYLQGNPHFRDEIRESLGGISLTWHFDGGVQALEAFPSEHLWALPVKHDKKYYLTLGVFTKNESGGQIRTLTYLPDLYVQNPKELSSFHKSLRRALKSQLVEDHAPFKSEVLVHNPRLLGHTLGLHWVLKDDFEGIHFVGDESFRVTSEQRFGLRCMRL